MITFSRTAVAGSDGLYGSVTSSDIKSHLESIGYAEIDIISIELQSQLKSLGSFPVKIGGVSVIVKITEAI